MQILKLEINTTVMRHHHTWPHCLLIKTVNCTDAVVNVTDWTCQMGSLPWLCFLRQIRDSGRPARRQQLATEPQGLFGIYMVPNLPPPLKTATWTRQLCLTSQPQRRSG